MREKINRLAKGIVDAEVPEILILPETCEGTVTAGQVCRKELYVADRYGCFVKGLVYSSHPCVRVLGNSSGETGIVSFMRWTAVPVRRR